MRNLVGLVALSSFTLVSGCSVREARIAVPSQLAASSERLELRGMGGSNRGSFQLGSAQGRFSRSAERLGILDPLIVQHRGGGTFRLERNATHAALSGRCSYSEGQINIGPVSMTPLRLAYSCEFARDDRALDAYLVLEDPKDIFGTLDGRSKRVGFIFYEGQSISIQSIHKDEGGGLPSPTPLGYTFTLEGRDIGAVDLNGPNKVIYAPIIGTDRDAVLAAALALSILWDPADVYQ